MENFPISFPRCKLLLLKSDLTKLGASVDQVEACLRHIQIFLEAKEYETGGPFRTFIDNWFQLKVGGVFLNRNGRPIWFNNPTKAKHFDALLSMDFISENALKVLEGLSDERLVKDHSIPVAVIRDILIDQKDKSLLKIEETLLDNYRLGVITKTDDNELNKQGLRAKMPSNWHVGDNQFARYAKIGLQNKHPKLA